MNFLFYTSCGMIIGNAYALYICNSPIKILWICGLITSLLNHSIQDQNNYYKQFFRAIDRYTMRYGFTVYTLLQVKYLYILYLSFSFYILSKVTKNDYFHGLSHLFVVIFHNKMLLTL